MALIKQPLNINFSQGLDGKTDPLQVQAGKFLSLQNAVFDKGGRLTKRNGYGALTSLPDTTSKYVTTFNGNLTALGNKLEAFSEGTNSWVNKGAIQPISLSTLPVIRSSYYQSQADSVVAPNGSMCVVYTNQLPSNGNVTPSYYYAILDSVTGQNIVAPTQLSTADATYGTPRVFLLGSYFVILFTTHPSAYHLQYIAISTANPTVVTTPMDIASAYIPKTTLSFDGIVVGTKLFIAYNTTTGGQAVKVTYLNSTLGSPVTAKTYSSSIATMFSLTADMANAGSPVIWVNFYDAASTNGYALAVDQNLNPVLAPTATVVGSTVTNLASTALNGVCTLFVEQYQSSNGNYIQSATITQAGSVGAFVDVVRSVGLASKAFLYNNVPYFLAVYSSTFQPSYFLMNGTASDNGGVIARLAYSNGGGYKLNGLPNITLSGSNVQIAYLYKDSIQAINTAQGAANAAGVFSQLGINQVNFNFAPAYIQTTEIGQNLNITGGYISGYDGLAPTEQNFFLFPENPTVSNPTHLTPTATPTNASKVLTSVSSTANVAVGMNISGTNIPSSTVVTAFTANTITMSNAATGSPGAETVTLTGNMSNQTYYYQITYEWSDNQGNTFRSTPSIPLVGTTSSNGLFNVLTIPTLRLTYKINNPVKIVVYRWSTAQQSYYQVTSLTAPLLNSTTVDTVTFVDISSDAQILGNNLIYTTGGVLEDTSPPSSSIQALFNNRLWLVDAEDPNLLWFSKQVIESTPVEMSDLLTLYVAPTTGSEGSTGPITALAPMDDKLIVFKQNALGYINGIGPDNTGANSQYSDFVLINSVVGCVVPLSIVLLPVGLMFQSNKGIWLVGRDLSTQYIGAPVENYTTGALVESAVNVPATNQVRLTLNTGVTLMYDYYFQQWGTFNNVPAISSTIYQNLHTYINSYGQVLQETDGVYLDNSSPVLMQFTTSWINLAGLQGFERFYHLYLLGEYITPFKLNAQLAYNYDPSITQATIITPLPPSGAWGADNLWGTSSPWGGSSSVFSARLFPEKQKCQSFQLTINEIYDPSYSIAAGAGLTLSGINMQIGIKKGSRDQSASRSFG